METAVITGVVTLMAVAVAIYVFRSRAERKRNRIIAESLDVIRLSADRSRIKGIVAEIDIEPAFEVLFQHAQDCPKEVQQAVRDMKERWIEIQRRVGEFNARDTVSTLQSSVAMVRTDKLVDEIHELAAAVETGLGAQHVRR